MWPKLRRYTAGFASAVLTGKDTEGYPFSVRCVPVFDDQQQIIQLAPVAGATMNTGQANLLFHSHNEELWDLQIISVLGALEYAGEAWVFHPERLIGDGQGVWHAIQMIVGARRSARRYLAKRGLARPCIPWDRFRSLYPQARQPKHVSQPNI